MVWEGQPNIGSAVRVLKHFKLRDDFWQSYRYSKLEGEDAWLLDVNCVSWCVWDNGGEVGVKKLNSDGPSRFVPLFWFSTPLTVGTLAARIATVLCGDEIDFGHDNEYDDEETKILLTA